MVTWKESLDLLDYGLVAGVPLSPAHLAPVSDKLFNGGLELVHVKCSGWPRLPRILLEVDSDTTSFPKFPLAVLNVFKHVEAVVNDGLQQLLVVVCTLADLGQVGQNIWQQILVVLW